MHSCRYHLTEIGAGGMGVGRGARSAERGKAEATLLAWFTNRWKTQSLNRPLLANFWNVSPPQPTFQLLSDLSSNSQRRDMDTSEQYPGAGQRGTSRGARGASTKGALLG